MRNQNLDETRKVYDNIHGFIEFPQKVWNFIDTKEFQRLRNIKQLGCLSQVFPGATHTRFQHSLGTGYLAKTYIEILIKNHDHLYGHYNQTELKSIIFTLTMAGVMHDIGHGPYSHTFDRQVVGKINVKSPDNFFKEVLHQQEFKWEHQLGSVVLFKYIIDKNSFLQNQLITKPEMIRIIQLIEGKKTKERPWEFQLISNKETGIDVDKLDYFRRDAFYMGAKNIYIDHMLLMKQSRIINNTNEDPKNSMLSYICYPTKYVQQVNDIFYSRFKLYKNFYLNNRSKGIQFMICDILEKVKNIYKFNQICENIMVDDANNWKDKYAKLTDNIIQKIEDLDETQQKNTHFRQQIIDAKALIDRIKTRKIYRFVRETQTYISEDLFKNQKDLEILNNVFKVQKIRQHLIKSGIPQQKFRIAVTDAGYGLTKENPLKKVKFFRKQLKKLNLPYKYLDQTQFDAEKISMLFTKVHAERYAKLYVTDDNVFVAANNAFTEYFKQMKKQIPVCVDLSIGCTPLNVYETEYHMGNQNTQAIVDFPNPNE